MSDDKALSPQGYIYDRDNPVNPFWGHDGSGGGGVVSATATVDNTTGTPGVTVDTEQVGEGTRLDFSFTGLKGEQGNPGAPGQSGDLYAGKTADGRPVLLKIAPMSGGVEWELAPTLTPGVYQATATNNTGAEVNDVRAAFLVTPTGSSPAVAITASGWDAFGFVNYGIYLSIEGWIMGGLADGDSVTATITLTDCTVSDTTPRTVAINYDILSVPTGGGDGYVLRYMSDTPVWTGTTGIVQFAVMDGEAYSTAGQTLGLMLSDLFTPLADNGFGAVAADFGDYSPVYPAAGTAGVSYYNVAVTDLSTGSSATISLTDESGTVSPVVIQKLRAELVSELRQYKVRFTGTIKLHMTDGTNIFDVAVPFEHTESIYAGDASSLTTVKIFDPLNTAGDATALKLGLIACGYLYGTGSNIPLIDDSTYSDTINAARAMLGAGYLVEYLTRALPVE